MATYLAKQGHGTSNAVAATLFELCPDDFGLCEDAPADEAQLAQLTRFVERMRAKPANDNTLWPSVDDEVALRAPAPLHDAGTSYAIPCAAAELARFAAAVEAVALAHGFEPRKCGPEPRTCTTRWLSGSYTTMRVYRLVAMR